MERSKTRLRCLNDAKITLKKNKIEFDSKFFYFSGKNKFCGIVKKIMEKENEDFEESCESI